MFTTRRAFIRTGLLLGGAALLSACGGQTTAPPAPAKPTEASKPAEAAKPASTAPASISTKGVTFSFWNGLTGADGKVMDGLIDRFTNETGIKIEQQRAEWPDLYAKLQVSVPAGEGPDLMLMHPTEIPHFAADEILIPIDEKTVSDHGFKAEDFLEVPWQGGIYEGKRYGMPLDVPQHLLYLNNQVFKAAGLVGADGTPRIPTNRDELLSMAKQIAKGDTFGFAIGTLNIGRYVWGFHNLLWQNDVNIFTPDLKKAAVDQPSAIEVAEFWGSINAKDQIAPPANANARDAFTAGKLGMWLAGSWNFTGLRDAKIDFTPVPVPPIFKKPVAWILPHQFTFPKSKTRDAAREAAVWTYIRWLTDHIEDWTLNAGQISAYKKPHQDPRIAGDPFFKVLLGQAPNWQIGQYTVKWVKAENLTRPQIESVYTGQKTAKDAMEELAKQINALPD